MGHATVCYYRFCRLDHETTNLMIGQKVYIIQIIYLNNWNILIYIMLKDICITYL